MLWFAIDKLPQRVKSHFPPTSWTRFYFRRKTLGTLSLNPRIRWLEILGRTKTSGRRICRKGERRTGWTRDQPFRRPRGLWIGEPQVLDWHQRCATEQNHPTKVRSILYIKKWKIIFIVFLLNNKQLP